MKVSYIFPWVNPLDKEWQDSYEKYSGKKLDLTSPRFRENSMIRYNLRSIAECIPWIDELIILVASESQILPWMNKETIKFVYHKDFIPLKFLPVFNSNTIEMFLANVITNPYIIYGNDDCYFTRKTDISEFFSSEGTPKFFTKKKTFTEKSIFQKTCYNNFNLIRDDFPGNEFGAYEYVGVPHAQVPMLRSTIREVYKKHRFQMGCYTTKFRDPKNNLNQYIYSEYQYLTGNHIRCPKNYSYINMKLDTVKTAEQCLEDETKPLLCLNDTDSTDDIAIKVFTGMLAEKFPNKCKYEI